MIINREMRSTPNIHDPGLGSGKTMWTWFPCPEAYWPSRIGPTGPTRPGQPFGDKYFWKWWKRACRNLKVEGVDLYGSTRHSSATALQEHFSPEEIKEAAMHGVNTAFQRYFRTNIRRLKAAYEKAGGGKGEKEVGTVVEGEF